MFCPISEYHQIREWALRYANKNTTLDIISDELNEFLRCRYPVTVSTARNEALHHDDFTMCAFYDYEQDKINNSSISIVIVSNREGNMPWQLSENQIKQLTMDVIESLTHEMQHRIQYRARQYEVYQPYHANATPREYYSHPDEIDAYAANIAVRLAILGESSSPDLDRYVLLFGNAHTVTKKLRKKITKQIIYLESARKSTICGPQKTK